MLKKDLYKILGVNPSATQGEIKKAYKEKVLEYHPDKNKDPKSLDKFLNVKEAYNILREDESREKYNQLYFTFFSHSSETHIMDNDSKLFDDDIENEPFPDISNGVFSHVFDNISNMAKRNADCNYDTHFTSTRHKMRTKDIDYNLSCSLEDLYNGCTKTIRIQLLRYCKECGGAGTVDKSEPQMCHDCHGTGEKINIYFDGLRTQNKAVICQKCKGRGIFIQHNKRCKKCHGSKIVKESVSFDVNVERGIEDGYIILLKGQGNDSPGYQRGDINVIINQIDHKIFTRYGDNLLYKKSISLTESLTGYDFYLKTLDNRILHIKKKGAIVKHKDVICINNEGMPKYRSGLLKGNMYVEFSVLYPTVIHEKVIEALELHMPPDSYFDESLNPSYESCVGIVDDDDPNVFTMEAFESSLSEFKSIHHSSSSHSQNTHETTTNLQTDDSSNTSQQRSRSSQNGLNPCSPM